LQSESLCKIPYVSRDKDRVVVTGGLDIKLGLQILYLCKIPRLIIQTGGGISS
jgi:hypothetical protein